MKKFLLFKLRFPLHKCLFEASSLLLLLGTFSEPQVLQEEGRKIIEEFASKGYNNLTGALPIKVHSYEAFSDGPHYGGSWEPGAIFLRDRPEGMFSRSWYLRHELAHEAVFRQCGSLSPWEQESLTLLLTNELTSPISERSIEEGDLFFDQKKLLEAVRSSTALTVPAERALRRIVKNYSFSSPCVLPTGLSAAVQGPKKAEPSWIVLSLLSGRILEESGKGSQRFPPGSLLKIAVASALKEPLTHEHFQALARSDEDFFLNRDHVFQLPLFCSSLGSLAHQEECLKNSSLSRSMLGLPQEEGYPYQGSLLEVVQMIRMSLLHRKESWAEMKRLQFLSGSTLSFLPPSLKNAIEELNAWGKTGTLSLSDGTPLMGYLFLTWPADNPTLLAVLRKEAVAGKEVVEGKESLLLKWKKKYSLFEKKVQAQILTLFPQGSFTMTAPCGVREMSGSYFYSSCGAVKVTSSLPRAKELRFFHGILQKEGQQYLLETDPLTFGEYIMEAEGADLPLPSKEVLIALGAWNGLHGGQRHSLGAPCDTTHCMVNKGGDRVVLPTPSAETLEHLQTLFTLLSREKLSHDQWIQFSEGGSERWERRIPRHWANQQLEVPVDIPLFRNRQKDGRVFFSVPTEKGILSTSCENVMLRLDLPSCPSSFSIDEGQNEYVAIGQGKGNLGVLSLSLLRELGVEKKTPQEILLQLMTK